MAASEALRASHFTTCKSWRQSRENLSMEDLARQVGARRPATTQGIHWPLTLSLRSREMRSSERFRSAAGHFLRWAKKAERGWGPFQGEG